MYFVYVVKSLKTGEYYKGLTDNLERRLDQHLCGEVDFKSTRMPLILIHVELCETREEARIIEKFFKSGFGRETIKELDGSLM